jgi:hypothetical protein
MRAPAWFWILGGMLLLWSIVGVAMFLLSLHLSAPVRAGMSAYDQHLYDSQPGWYYLVYGVATWAGLIGSALLLARRRLAQAFYIVSLVAVVVMFGWMFTTTDIIAVKGLATAAGFPVVIALIAALQIWFAGYAAGRWWTR